MDTMSLALEPGGEISTPGAGGATPLQRERELERQAALSVFSCHPCRCAELLPAKIRPPPRPSQISRALPVPPCAKIKRNVNFVGSVRTWEAAMAVHKVPRPCPPLWQLSNTSGNYAGAAVEVVIPPGF